MLLVLWTGGPLTLTCQGRCSYLAYLLSAKVREGDIGKRA